MGLQEYRRKRNFRESAEPKGNKKTSHENELQFVVQEHHASHLHYDFRLEVEGVLKSWAVPKGPSLDPSEKRLAVQVEDHPFEYRTFEGTIPKGSYGAGTVKIWDNGTYHAEGSSNRQESERLMLRGLQKGHLNFYMNGRKLNGGFSLVRMHGDQSNQWLLIKKNDEYASTSSSVIKSISSNQHIPSSSSKVKNSLSPEANPAKMPSGVKPMLATLVDEPFDDKDWIFEIKWDGYRALAEIHKDRVHLYSRNFQSFDRRFPPLVDDLNSIKVDALLDGEIVVLDEQGKPSFQLVQNYQKNQIGTLIYYVFDLLYLEGHDIRTVPLIKRKELLKKLLPDTPHIRFCDHVQKRGIDFFKAASQKGLEGIIAKQSQSVYQTGRSRTWLKIKIHHRQEAIICGFTLPQGSREKFGSLLLGVYDHEDLIYTGHTGSGFDRQMLIDVNERLQPLIQSKCPFASLPKLRSKTTWVKPEIVCEVSFAEWTKSGLMRQAIFVNIREDKKAKEVVREHTLPVKNTLEKHALLSDHSSQPLKIKGKKETSAGVKLVHLDKVFWPDEGYTKGDLINYYQQVAPLILPYLKDRPEILRRYPNGIEGPSFYQKEAGGVPAWVRTEMIQHENRQVHYAFIEDEKSLLSIINLGCIDLNPFNSRFQSLHNPDYLVMDLDPEGVTFEAVIEVARTIHSLLEKWKIPSICKTSGATGMHIYIPMEAHYTYEEVKQFGKLIAHIVHDAQPDLTSLERSPSKRQERVYLDYLQNNFGQSIVAPYSIRPLPGAPVSTPLKWSEVKAGLNPIDFTIKTAPNRFAKVGDLFKPVLGKGINLQSILKKIKL
jgi:bifunctional non-homologous end joining protein LigD